MKRVPMLRTRDGRLHESVRAAKRHADVLYTKALCRISAKIVHIEKYRAMQEFLDGNLNDFIELAALKAEMEIERDSDRLSQFCEDD